MLQITVQRKARHALCFKPVNYEVAMTSWLLQQPCCSSSVFISRPMTSTAKQCMVIVWRFRGNIIRTVLYFANVLPLQWAQLTNTVHTARLGLEFVFLCFFGLNDLSLCVYVLFYLGQLSHLPSCCGAGVTNLNEPPSSLLLPPHYCGLGAGSILLRAIVNKKQCEMRGLFMSLVIHY